MKLYKLFLLCIIVLPVYSWSHGLDLETRYEEGQIIVEGKYENGNPIPHAKVLVLDKDGTFKLEMTTDHHGMAVFDVSPEKDFQIILETLDGHRAKKSIGTFFLGPHQEESDHDIHQALDHLEERISFLETKVEENKKEASKIAGLVFLFGIIGLVILFKKKRNV